MDIVIPVFGHADMLRKCLFSLDKNSIEDMHVFIVDDNTPVHLALGLDEIYASLPKWAEVIKLDKNSGYAHTNNIGVSKGNSENVLLLNSDVEIQEGCLTELEATLERHPQVGIVGTRLIYPLWQNDPNRPRGRTQHAGVVFNIMRMPYHIFMGWQPDHQKVMQFRMMQAVTGACMLVRRETYEKLDGLDERYGKGNFEDIALCLGAREKLGVEIAYQPKATAWHYGSGSDNTSDIEKNADIFLKDWREKVIYDEWKYW